MTEKLTGGQAIVKSLIAEGIDTVFGLPGVQNDWLYNAFFDYKDKIKVIHSDMNKAQRIWRWVTTWPQEKKAFIMSFQGPGFLNSTAALVTAYGLGARVMCLVGQIPTKAEGRGWSVLHEIPHQMEMLKNLTKWADKIDSPLTTTDKIEQAFKQLRSE